MKKISMFILLSLFSMKAFSMEHGKNQDWNSDPDVQVYECSCLYPDETHPTSNNFGVITNHGVFQPQFLESVFEREEQEILDVGAGDGPLLKQILKDERNKRIPVRYTVIDICNEHLQVIDRVVKEYSTNPDNWFGKARKGDIRDFIQGKINKYDQIWCAQLIQYFDPFDQLNILQGFYQALKEGGQLYLVVDSFVAVDLWYFRDFAKEMRNENPWFLTQETLEEKYQHLRSQLWSKKQKGDLWPGYLLEDPMFVAYCHYKRTTKNCPAGDIPTLHCPSSLRALLQAIGFEVVQCFQFKDLYENEKSGASTSTIRVGAVAKKIPGLGPQQDMLEAYQKAAHEKRKEKEEIKEYFIKNVYSLGAIGKIIMQSTLKAAEHKKNHKDG